ncbi:MAG TPA: DUF1501 domain-containing protein [Terriglobia bacterium]|nr:DUF1501 domain-containing protein [Terriglobia bacterium]
MLKRAASFAALNALVREGEARISQERVTPRRTARVCIVIFLNGGPSHIDTFDVKDASWNPPDANIQQQGKFALSQTLFPKFSQLTGDLCVLRSVRSWEAAHERGVFYMQTAHPSNPAFVAETPHIGAVVGLENSGPDAAMPPFLSLNQEGSTAPMQGSTFLGGQLSPFAAPTAEGGLATIEHNFFGEPSSSQRRFEERYRLRGELEVLADSGPDLGKADHAVFYQTAKRMVYNQNIAKVFQFSRADNDRYGGTDLGRAAIVARNAVQANNGTVFIALTQGGWDLHQNMFYRTASDNMYKLCYELDTAIATLVWDLKASGNFSETLIVLVGEFGRTPGPLNPRGGRDHHRDAMSVVMMGGGIAGGRIIGATNNTGAAIVDPGWSAGRPIVMEDIAATIYDALGINWTKSIEHTPSGRKFEYVPFAAQGLYVPINEVFA